MTIARDHLAVAAIAILLAVAFPFLDLPRPHFDDLFYIGSALNLANGGALYNPPLARHLPPAANFLFGTPVQPVLLGGWLRMTGISAHAILLFQSVCIVAGSYLLLLFFRAREGSFLFAIATFLFVMACFLPMGLRADGLGFLLFAGGLFLLRNEKALAIATALVVVGSICAPRFGILFLFIAAAVAAIDLVQRGANARSFLKAAAQLFFGAALAIALVGWTIDWRFSELAHNLALHGAARAVPPFHVRDFGPPTQIAFALVCVVAALSVRRPVDRLAAAVVAAVTIPATMLLAKGLLVGSVAIFAAGFIALRLWSLHREREGVLLRVAKMALLAGAAVLMNLTTAIDTLAMVKGAGYCGSQCATRTAAILRPFEGQQIGLDPGSARYIYDYRLPRGSFDVTFSEPFPAQAPPNCRGQKPSDVWVVSRFPWRWGFLEVVPAPESARITGVNWRMWLPVIDEVFVVKNCAIVR